MASIGKKILSAFVEVTDAAAPVKKPEESNQSSAYTAAVNAPQQADNHRFRQYFENLFKEANLPGPDYYEFSKMIEAMNSIPDEKARYSAAFAGLQVQGLDKQKLLATAAAYLQILDKDAGNFHLTVDAAIQEKVLGKQEEAAAKTTRIQQLTTEINDLQNQVAALSNEIKENEQKLAERTDGYKQAMENMKGRIQQDTEKIKTFIH
jgi:peptidoglycan hydrolase CwlO-like protein